MAFSPDGRSIVAGGGDFGVRESVVLWHVATRKRLLDEPLGVKGGQVVGAAFSLDGKTFAAGYRGIGLNGGVVLWDVAARKRLVDEPLAVKEGHVASVAIAPDGKTIAAGYHGRPGNSGVVVWDTVSRKRLVEEPFTIEDVRASATTGYVASVAFSPDSRTIAAGYRGGGNGDGHRVVLCNVDLESWQRLAGQIANRNFTQNEWREYFPEERYHLTFPDLPDPREATPK